MKEEIKKIYILHEGRYGYRRLTIGLNDELKTGFNEKKIRRLCQEMGLQSKIKVKRKYPPKKSEQISENILAQDFYASEPNKKWVTDITEIRFNNSKHYLCGVMDLFNRELIAYSMGKHANSKLVNQAMLESFSKNKGVKNILIHSDQGSQFTSFDYKNLLKKHKQIPSNSRAGNCLDNAMIENFFSHFKSELIYNTKILTEEMLYKEVKDYMYYYNNIRVQNKTKMTPIQIKQQFINNFQKVSN
jgi:transposase InsO family protein